MRFTSRDVERVEETWKQFVPSAELQRVDPKRFLFDWTSADLGSVAVIQYDLAAQVESVAQPEDQFLICRVDATDAEVSSGREALDAGQPWLTDGAQVRARWQHTAQVRALVIDRDAAQARVRQITGDDSLSLRASGLGPTTDALGLQWERAFAYLQRSFSDAADSQILRGELERHALTITLSTFPTTIRGSLTDSPQRAAAPASVRRALTYIDDNAHRPITVDDVAAAVFMSTRGLQYAFRRALDMSPAEYLRRVRLEGAHQELREAERPSIATIARRWGYSHPSRFAAAYREAYGVLPSTTSRRSGR